MSNNVYNNIIMQSGKGVKGNGEKFVVFSSKGSEIQFEKDRKFVDLKQQNMVRIKPCHLVVRETTESDFGVCYREVCTFAQSIAELNVPQCVFNDNCKKIHATFNHETGKNDSENKCQFKHPFETVEQYFKRTRKPLPDLPKTHEKSRVEKKSVEKVNHNTLKKEYQDTLWPVESLKKTVEKKKSTGKPAVEKPVEKSAWVQCAEKLVDNPVEKKQAVKPVEKKPAVKQSEKDLVEDWLPPTDLEKLRSDISENDKNLTVKEAAVPTTVTKIMVPREFVNQAIESAIKLGVVNFEIVILE